MTPEGRLIALTQSEGGQKFGLFHPNGIFQVLSAKQLYPQY